MPNVNCLEGIACPECESEGPFGIACDIVMEISDDGTESPIGDITWEDDSYCECRACMHKGTVKDFFTLRKRFKALLQASDDAHLEYEEKHGDAGAAYVHLVVEEKNRSKEKLKEYLTEHMPEVTEAEQKAILKNFDQWCIDMQPGHRFSTTKPEEGCCVGSWALEEVENQHEVKRYAEELDCEEHEVRDMACAEEKEGDFCIRCSDRDKFDTFLTYQCTDAVWCAVVPREWIDGQLEELRNSDED